MTPVTRERLLRLPKTDLHVHPDGSVRPGTLVELAAACGKPLPSTDPAELRRLLVPGNTRPLT